MYAKEIRVKYYKGLVEDMYKWRCQGFTGDIVIIWVNN